MVFKVLTCRLLAVFLLFLPASAARAELVRDGHVQVELVSSDLDVVAGQGVLLALRMVHDEGWHSYWISSTTGYPTTIKFEGMSDEAQPTISWPVPKIHKQDFIVDYVYDGEVLIPLFVRVPETLKPGDIWHLKADVGWLMCDESCVPGSATVTLDLPVTSPEKLRSKPVWGSAVRVAYDEAGRDHPQTFSSLLAVQSGREITLSITPSAYGRDLREKAGAAPRYYFFSSDGSIFASVSQTQTIKASGEVEMKLSLSEYAPERMEDLRGLLAYSEDPGGSSYRRDYYVSIPVRQAVAAEGVASQSFGGLAAALLFGVLGGLILNLMPCVFPILGLKVMSFVKQAGQSHRAAWAHSLVFTLGVLVSLWTLAGALLAFRAAGHSVGWGFQLQNPGVLFVGIIIFLLFGLNMLGVFEVGMGAAGIGQGVTNKSGLVGAFFSGVLAVVVATPCSAPFLGTAIGYAMVQPAVLLFAVFSAIGLGFALPYLLFAAFPKLLRFLPKPGMWMVRLKQAMSLLLFATVAYLVWVLRAFLDTETQLVSLVIAMILIVLAAVLYGHFSLPHVVRRKRVPGVLAAILLLGMGVYGGWPRVLPASPTDRAETDGVRMFSPAFSASSDKPVFEEWTSGLPESLASGGAVVYADFTARWCATCQVNKALVFGSQEVRDYMREHKVIVLEADWTRQDAAITDELARWGRFAVPFNVVYAPGMDPMELPQVLTPGIVLDALKKAVAARESSYPNASK